MCETNGKGRRSRPPVLRPVRLYSLSTLGSDYYWGPVGMYFPRDTLVSRAFFTHVLIAQAFPSI